jgi:ABC-type oligopeptide transport system ATPase subunit
VRGLTKIYRSESGWGAHPHVVRAVDDVSLHVARGETFGLVGESGCGKSTVARCILNLVRPTAGEIWFEGQPVTRRSPAAQRLLRREMQVVFQDPYSSLDPRMSIRASLLEPLQIHGVGNRQEREARVNRLLELVGLPPSALRRYPHEFSGGQLQRVGIARALALQPKLVLADEPVSALDLSVRAQVINLMLDLQREFALAYLFIAHDLTLVRHVCQRVAVMFQGQIVEQAATDALFSTPLHPYTRRLLAAIPPPDPTRRSVHGAGGPAAVTGAEEPQAGASALVEASPGHWVRQAREPAA